MMASSQLRVWWGEGERERERVSQTEVSVDGPVCMYEFGIVGCRPVDMNASL